MSSFTKPLITKKLYNGTWELYDDLIYHVGSELSDEVIVVPRGYQTDFASVPRLFWSIFPPDGRYSAAAVVHDWLYDNFGLPYEYAYTRKEADQIFLEAMAVLKVPAWKRHTMYRAVRMFGPRW